uniref:Uncharacterized protein n=1 Tax=Mucochytrium quahogii TaxID=96639 RepID=A0A7S2SKT7_9STRA|mmetsp:Transcript_9943/g.18822  ORF Transcript_9943/g.18822 Transcript_9943/m.18822 type:complete len:283 (-) Transcript_9943:2660-3508(-)
MSSAQVSAGGDVPDSLRSDKKAMEKMLMFVQSTVRKNEAGEVKLTDKDVEFLKQSQHKIGRFGFGGGAAAGGIVFAATRNSRPAIKFGGVISAWVIGSGIGRFYAIDHCLQNMLSLPKESYLGSGTRKIVERYAEPSGFFQQRYIYEVPAEVNPGIEFGLDQSQQTEFEQGTAQEKSGDFNIDEYFSSSPSIGSDTLNSGTKTSTEKLDNGQVIRDFDYNPINLNADPLGGLVSDPFAEPKPEKKTNFEDAWDDDVPYQPAQVPANRSWDDIRRDYAREHGR